MFPMVPYVQQVTGFSIHKKGTHMKSRGTMFLLLAFVCLGFHSLVAHADVITFNVSGTVSPEKGAASCSPTCTVSGTFTLDNSTGAVSAASIAVSGESPTVGTFSYFGTGGGSGVAGANTSMSFYDAGFVDLLKFYFATPTASSLVGYTGGPIVKILMTDNPSPDDWTGRGEFTNTAVPEPSSVMLLGSGLAGFAGLIRRKLNR